MIKPIYSTAFKKDLKKYRHYPRILIELELVMEILCNQMDLLPRHKDHQLTGNWNGYRECHVKNDVLLIYKFIAEGLLMARFGTHSDLF